jgi:branched-chain amino acid transport system substrate-binding protein
VKVKLKSRKGGAGTAGALVLLALGLSGCGLFGGNDAADKPAAPKPPATAGTGFRPGQVSFGVLAPLSGPQSARGKDLVDGAKLAMADLNVRGGVIGQKVALVTRDDGCTATASRESAKALEGSEVAGVLGGICASAARSAARTLEQGLPFLVTSANAPSIVSANRTPTAYLINGTPYQSALAAVHFLAYQTAQRLSVVTEDDRASKFLGGQVLGLAAPAPKPLSQQAVPSGTTDWETYAKAALSGRPDTLYWAGSAAGGGAFLAALRAAGYDGNFIASARSESDEFLSAAGDAAEGAFVIAPASPQNLPEAADWAARFQKLYGRPPGFDALQAYNAVRALAQAVTQSGKVDRERNSQELTLLDPTYTTFLGDAGLAFASDHTIRNDNTIALEVKGGDFAVANTLRSDAGG